MDTEEKSVVAEEPSSEPTVKTTALREETRNIAEIFGGFAVDSNNRIQGRAATQNGEESVSQSLLKNKAFLILLGQKPPFELRPKTAVDAFHIRVARLFC